jgi:hypothetical protein
MNWREYQDQAAKLFRSIGCKTEIDKKVHGVRGSHDIDVWVGREIYGLEHQWIVECKHWRRRVTKQQVVVLKGIVDDVGADRGILFSNSGFQSGAISIAERSNITLSSLEEMRESIRDEVERYTLSSLESKAAMLADGLHGLYTYESKKEGSYFWGTSRQKPGVNEKAVMDAGVRLAILEYGFRSIRMGKRAIPIRFDEGGNTLRRTDDVGKLLEAASKILW